MRKKDGRQNLQYTAVLLILLGAVFIAVSYRIKSLERISFAEHLDDTAVTVDGTEYKFRDLAVYLASKEQEVQEQAKAYDLKQTSKYWNAHTNGSFIRIEAKDTAMETVVHDVIFYRMAEEQSIRLTQEEAVFVENQKIDFWNDLEEEGQERLGVSYEEIEETFRRMALAQKAQQRLADQEGVDCSEYYFNGESYQKLLGGHEYKINTKLWKRLNFGNIITN